MPQLHMYDHGTRIEIALDGCHIGKGPTKPDALTNAENTLHLALRLLAGAHKDMGASIARPLDVDQLLRERDSVVETLRQLRDRLQSFLANEWHASRSDIRHWHGEVTDCIELLTGGET